MKEITVVAGLIRREGRILLAQRPQGDALAGFWEFPGGKVEPGETEEAALARELQEELGVTVAVGPFLGESRTPQPQRIILLRAYFCTLTQGEPVPRFHQDLRWSTPSELTEFLLAEADRPFLSCLTQEVLCADNSTIHG